MDEKYICPRESGWEKRYYKRLFPKLTECHQDIIDNYIEGLSWVYDYYRSDCTDWQYSYKYPNVPLQKDIVLIKPVQKKYRESVSEIEQLQYVMPVEGKTYEMKYIYKRFNWEGMPMIPV
jgi:5'-3' exoribonuclease 2